MSRTVIWIAVTVSLFIAAIFLWVRHLSYSGAIGSPWIDFTPDWTLPLVAFPVLLIVYIALLIRRASPRLWLLGIIGSVIPCLAALPSCFFYLHHAAMEAASNRGEGSDPDFQTAVALSTFTLSLILAALLANMAVYGRIYRKI